jgi:hypothetical protein
MKHGTEELMQGFEDGARKIIAEVIVGPWGFLLLSSRHRHAAINATGMAVSD